MKPTAFRRKLATCCTLPPSPRHAAAVSLCNKDGDWSTRLSGGHQLCVGAL